MGLIIFFWLLGLYCWSTYPGLRSAWRNWPMEWCLWFARGRDSILWGVHPRTGWLSAETAWTPWCFGPAPLSSRTSQPGTWGQCRTRVQYFLRSWLLHTSALAPLECHFQRVTSPKWSSLNSFAWPYRQSLHSAVSSLSSLPHASWWWEFHWSYSPEAPLTWW